MNTFKYIYTYMYMNRYIRIFVQNIRACICIYIYVGVYSCVNRSRCLRGALHNLQKRHGFHRFISVMEIRVCIHVCVDQGTEHGFQIQNGVLGVISVIEVRAYV